MDKLLIDTVTVRGKDFPFRVDVPVGEWARARLLVVKVDNGVVAIQSSLDVDGVDAATKELEKDWAEFLALAFDPVHAPELSLDKLTYNDMLEIVGRFTPAALAIQPKPTTA